MSDEAKPFAWAVIGDAYEYATLLAEHAGAVAEEEGGRVVPLYRSPTLTEEERRALADAEYEMANLADDTGSERDREIAATLRGLLERLT